MTLSSLGIALATCDLRSRDWSHDDRVVFAIYDLADSYLGIVEIVDTDNGPLMRDANQRKLSRKERSQISALIAAHNKVTP